MFSAEVVKQSSFLICSKDGTYAINVLKGGVRFQHAHQLPRLGENVKTVGAPHSC